MPSVKKYLMWVWQDAQGVVRYVGHGKPVKNKHPAAAMWAERARMDSPLHNWLQQLPEEPARTDATSIVPMTHDEIMCAVMALRKKHEQTILSARCKDTYKGGYPARPVFTPHGGYGSVRAAADAIGTSAATITRKCRSPEHPEWGYV